MATTANERVVGRYFQEKQIGFVVPDNKRLHQDIFIPPGQEKQARHGQFVVVKITRQPDKHTQPVGEVTEIIGDHITRGIATDVAGRVLDALIPQDVLLVVAGLSFFAFAAWTVRGDSLGVFC